jgi:hypothetical protein
MKIGIGIGLAIALAAAPDAAAADSHSRRGALLCGAAPSRVAARQYIVKGRVRPLLFWTGQREVGGASYEVRESADGGRRLELLIGTDPERAPMRINRWGYIAETVCDDHAALVGLMTESNEETIEQAQAAAEPGERGQVFKAIRARAAAGSVATEILTVAPPGAMTYRDLDGVLARLPAPGSARDITAPPGADSGFLVAVTGLIHDSVERHRQGGRARRGASRAYVYGGRLYDVTLGESRTPDPRAPAVVESEFEIRNRATGSITAFRIAYAVTGPDAEVPVRIVYRPRWWLELELQLETRP